MNLPLGLSTAKAPTVWSCRWAPGYLDRLVMHELLLSPGTSRPMMITGTVNDLIRHGALEDWSYLRSFEIEYHVNKV